MADDKPTNEAPKPKGWQLKQNQPREAPKKKGGWPAGKPRGRPAWNARPKPGVNARPDGRRWQDPRYEKFTKNAPKAWTDFSGENPLVIDQGTIENIRREGFELEWLTESVMGASDICAGQLNQKMRNGFTRLESGDFGIDVIATGGLALYARPRGLQQAAEKAELDKAQDQIRRKQEAHMMGDLPGVSLASRHPSARQYNHHKRSIERLDVPDDGRG